MNRLISVITFFFLATIFVKANDFVFTPINVSHGLSDNQIRYILQLSDGRMVFTTSGNLNLYDGTRFKYIHRTSEHIYPLKNYNGFYRIYQSGDSLLWIKDNLKLMCIDLRQEKYISNLDSYLKAKGVEETIDDFFVDSENRWWLLSDGRLRYQSSSEFFNISDDLENLQDLMADDNNLYLFYNTGEIVCYDLKTRKKLYSKTAYPTLEQESFKNTSLVVKSNNGFYQLRNGSKGGFFFFDTQEFTWNKLLEADYSLNTLILHSDETAYISCTNGIWIINCRNGDKQYLPVLKTVDGNILDTEISTLFSDKQGGLWLGTLNQGLLYYHPSRYKFTYIGRAYFQDSFTKEIIVQAFAEDKNGNIFVKCGSKIYQYHLSEKNNKTLTQVNPSSLAKEILGKLNQQREHIFQGNYYTDLCTDTQGWIWCGTQDGLKLFVPGEQEKTFYTEDGLSNNFVHAVLEDRNQNIWVTTSYGISKIQIDSINKKIDFINFNSYDGTLDGEYADGSAFEATDGTLYFGGINGFNILHPRDITSTILPFKPVFTNLFLKGEKIDAGNVYDGRIILHATTPYTKEIELSYNQNFLSFEFSALNYQNPSQTTYRYRLDGIDNDWQEVSKSGKDENTGTSGILQISYTNLPHGKYTLHIMASDNNKQWSENVSELKITIQPPWWKTPVAYILYAIFFILMISISLYAYTYFTKKRLERSHKEEILLLRIKNLIEQCSQLEAEKESNTSKVNANINLTEPDSNQSSADSTFLTKAIELVEKNLNEPNYSVEQLSRDLCMDRTGLYRKLIALLDKSPSLFIRNIRLQKAAQLILEEELNITEIAEKVGFSSSSYLSKCFQEMYGCRPSEYAEKVKNQHK